MNSATCSLFFHNYYGSHEYWIKLLSEKFRFPFTLFYNIVDDSLYNIDEDHRLSDRLDQFASGPYLQKIILRRSPNQGKDIGGKLVLLDACLREGIDTEYHIFLHDKKSPYKAGGQEWRDRLFRIIEPSFIEHALEVFEKNKQIGIIAGSDNIRDEYDHSLQSFTSNNRDQLAQLRSTLAINSQDYRYVAGTMFWARSSPILNFFSQHPPLEIRKSLERGNIMDETTGSITHSWERMLSWLIFAQGYTIKGL